MIEKIVIAIESFRSGNNCAQSVLLAHADNLDFDNRLALDISSGFGGGMGKLQETCGAVTGAYMVIGIHNSKKYDDQLSRDKSVEIIQEFARRFNELHGTTSCKTLLNSDLNTLEGQAYIKENKLGEKVCEKCISDSIQILNELL